MREKNIVYIDIDIYMSIYVYREISVQKRKLWGLRVGIQHLHTLAGLPTTTICSQKFTGNTGDCRHPFCMTEGPAIAACILHHTLLSNLYLRVLSGFVVFSWQALLHSIICPICVKLFGQGLIR